MASGTGAKDIVGIANEYNCDPESCGPDQPAFFLIRNHGNRDLGPNAEFLLQEPLGSRWWDFDVADLDNDDGLDVAISQSGNVLRTFLNQDGGLVERTQLGTFAGFFVALADFNSDRYADIAWSPEVAPAKVWAGNGADEYNLVQDLGFPLINVLAANITIDLGPDLTELVVPNEGTDYRLTVVPNLTYMDPAAAEDPIQKMDTVLRVAPAVITGGGCTIQLQGVEIGRWSEVELEVVDVAGRVRTTPELGSSRSYVRWDGTDAHGYGLPSGVYWIKARGLPHVPACLTIVG